MQRADDVSAPSSSRPAVPLPAGRIRVTRLARCPAWRIPRT
nr:MAG TPA: hypothetical protein [Caudoviricetes sp.]